VVQVKVRRRVKTKVGETRISRGEKGVQKKNVFNENLKGLGKHLKYKEKGEIKAPFLGG